MHLKWEIRIRLRESKIIQIFSFLCMFLSWGRAFLPTPVPPPNKKPTADFWIDALKSEYRCICLKKDERIIKGYICSNKCCIKYQWKLISCRASWLTQEQWRKTVYLHILFGLDDFVWFLHILDTLKNGTNFKRMEFINPIGITQVRKNFNEASYKKNLHY